MYLLMVVVFVLGYLAIALEHPIKIDKAASALLIGSITWTIFALGADSIMNSTVESQQLLANLSY